MSIDAPTSDSELAKLSPHDQDRVAEIVEQCLVALENGQSFSIDEIVAKHPTFAEPLRHCLAGLQTLHDAVSPSRETVPNHPSLPIGGQLGDFELQRVIGRGGMGVVYAARQLSLDRLVALKVLSTTWFSQPKQVKRFLLEAQAAANLHHPHIVPVYSIGESDGNFYYAMQLIQGQSLDQHDFAQWTTDRYGRLLEVAISLGEALQYAHDCGIIHRDIKPSNLIMDDSGHVWIADFGLARRVQEPGLTVTGELVGTANYMSPEQVQGKPVDIRTDVYSLGITLYELATGKQAFTGESQRLILQKVENCEPVKPRRLNPDLPVDLETVILKAIAKDREDRYPSFTEFVEDLGAVRDGRPISGRRPGLAKRATRWVMNHKAVAATASVGIATCLLVLAVAAGKLWLINQDLSAALQQSEQHQQTAQQNYWKARNLLSDWQRNVIGELNQLPGAERVREVMLADTIAHYESYLNASSQDQRLPIDLMHAQLQLAAAYRESGNSPSALRLYREILQPNHSPFESRQPNDKAEQVGTNLERLQLQWLVAQNDYALLLLEKGDTTSAIQCFQQALAASEHASELNETNVDRLVLLATLNVNFFKAKQNLPQRPNDSAELLFAEQYLRRAITLAPLRRELCSDLGAVYDHEAVIFAESNLPQALALASDAVQQHRQAIHETDYSLGRHLRLQTSQHNFAVLKARSGDIAGARTGFLQGIKDVQQLLHWSPQNREAQKLFVDICETLGLLELQANNQRAAALAFGQSIQSLQSMLKGTPSDLRLDIQFQLATAIVHFSKVNTQVENADQPSPIQLDFNQLSTLLEQIDVSRFEVQQQAIIKEAVLAAKALSIRNHQVEVSLLGKVGS